jgi:hypothetical protein
MSKAKKNKLQPNAQDCCEHDNDADNPNKVFELVRSDGSFIYAVRQCSICCNSAQRMRPVNADYLEVGIDVFFDWDKDQWEPISKHAAYQAAQLAKRKGPDDPTDIIEGE